MIYELYIAGMRDETTNKWYNDNYGNHKKEPLVDDWKALREVLKNTSHTFILMPGPSSGLLQKLKDHKLDEFVTFNIPYMLTNPVHPGQRRIQMFVLKGTGNEV